VAELRLHEPTSSSIRDPWPSARTASATAIASARAAVATLVTVALAAQYGQSVTFWHHVGVTSIPGKSLDFALFFTEDSNAAAVVVLVVGVVRLALATPPTTAWTTTRLAVTVCVVMTAVADNVLLRGMPHPDGSVLPWADDVVHIVGPALVLLDWFVAPDRVRLPVRLRTVGVVAAAPVVWLVVTLARGPFTGDQASDAVHYYPYGFLDPDTSRYGYGSVAGYVLALLVFLTVTTLALSWSTWLPWPRSRPSTGRIPYRGTGTTTPTVAADPSDGP
jgi:hypothetical protein